jgi:hypothetical protein
MKEGILKKRIRGAYGGDQGDEYMGNKAAYIADLPTVKLLLNKVVSTKGARFMTLDITDFYLGTPLMIKQYMKVHKRMVPEVTRQHFNLTEEFWDNDHIFVEISKGMYGLTEAGVLAQERLYEHLKGYGYELTPNTPGLLRHRHRDITFTLVVDDFGVYYTNKDDVEHLINALMQLYQITIDWTGSRYLRLQIHHDIENETLQISMPEYIPKALTRFGITQPKTMNAPGPYTVRTYGAQQQFNNIDNTPIVSQARKHFIQEVVGVCMYYARAVDCTMLCSVNKLASQQSNPTEQVERSAYQLLNYAATWPDATVTYRPSDMKLRIFSDASYNSEAGARSRAGGHYDLICSTQDPYQQPLNGHILATSQMIDCVVSSAAEAEYAALFMNGKEGKILRQTLCDLGYPQQATPIYTDNACALGIVNETINMKKSKTMDMRFHWIRDQRKQGTYIVEWQPGPDNYADYFTKEHPTGHHKKMRFKYLTKTNISESPKGVLMQSQDSRY